ncbi:MAG: Streptogramin lyase [Candidatus Accumulibacter phosphatis]|jgi:hypothetical protein|uniref:Streptogramin lyase n=2 Tax=Candidatus Accumulibacter TaxID=327159 RepID=A0A080LZ74_9PROT|nr:MAG: Streptogramin lyase [Candidatus Accumulibacter phosphatis]
MKNRTSNCSMSNLTLTRLAAALAASCWVPIALAGTTVYTLDAQFDQGVLSGVNHDTPNNDQLQLSSVGTTFPVLWVANAGEDTLSKIDTTTGKELARYRTFFGSGPFANHTAFSGPAPSRSAVDINGNAYILNRHFDGGRPSLMKVLAEGFIDRNANTTAETSTDGDISGSISSSETKDVVDDNSNGHFDCAIPPGTCESRDERVAWVTTFPAAEAGQLGRALCIGTDGNLWAGMYNSGHFYKIRASDGVILSGPHSVPWNPYGCLVDGAGILWSASLSGRLGRLDTSNPASVSFFDDSSQNYGIALGNGKVYLGSLSGFGFREFTPGPNTFTTPGGSKGFASTGISVDGSGNIWTGFYSGGGVKKYSPAGAELCSGASQSSTETRGVIVDSDNNVWQINRLTNSVSKYRGSDCAPLGVFPVGFDPYTYSDATGFAARNITSPTGTWTVIKDSGVSGQAWSKVSWTEQVPTGASVQVSVRADNNQAILPNLAYQPVVNGANPGVSGRFIQVQVRLNANTDGASPILFDLTLNTSDGVCDVDRDGDIDSLDLSLISKARGQTPLPGDPRDANGDGRIDPADVKFCIPRCTRANCAIN